MSELVPARLPAGPASKEAPNPSQRRSDRFVGGLLLVFLLALYLLTGGGHGYSPDGEFAYNMARSLTVDPKHEYLSKMRQSFSQWGFMVSALSQPLVLLGEPLSHVMPQKDYVTVDGRTYVLGIFRGKELSDDAPTVGPQGNDVNDSYTRTNLSVGPATSLAVISFLSLAENIPPGTTVAEISLVDSSGEGLVLPVRAGVETAEWKVGKGGGGSQIGEARVASIWSGNTLGRNYYAELPFDRALKPTDLRIHYLADEGRLYIRTLGFLNQETGAVQAVPSDYRLWSERENAALFARLFYSPYNAIMATLGCVLLFAMARLLGYSQAVSVAATLLYGVSTMAWPYSKYDFSEPTLALLVLASLYLVLRWGQGGRDSLLVLAGLAALGSVGTKYVAAVLVPAMLLQILLLHWEKRPSARDLPQAARPLLLFCAPFLVLAAPAVWYLGQRFGYYPSILEAWAGIQRGWLPLPLLIGLRGLLFSPGKSLFLYSPPMVLALFSAIPFVRRHRMQSVGLLAIALVYFTLYSKKVAWHAGNGWGPRYQLLVIPLVILMIAPLIQKAIEERSRWARYALLTVLVLGIGVQLLGVSKSFDKYLGMFRYQIVNQLPDQGAQYGGEDYYPYSEGLDGGNSVTATVWAWPFSPILAHVWLLSSDFLSIGPSFLQPAKEKLLGMPPWRLWGIDIVPANPEHGLGFDFWSMWLWTDFPSYPIFRAEVLLLVVLLETTLVAAGMQLVSLLFGQSTHRTWAIQAWIVASISVSLLFDGIHFLL